MSATTQPVPFGHARQHLAPVIDDHRIAEGLAPARMHAPLRRRDQPAQVFDGACAQQRFPMRLARGHRERRRHHEQVGALARHHPEQLRKAHVVAHREPELAHRGFHHARIAARHGVRRFAMRFGAAGHIDVEQVNLVVARRALSVGLVDQAGGRHATVGVLAQRHRAADDPYLEAPGRVRQEVLDAAGAVRLGHGALVAAVLAHEGEVFRQCGQHRVEPRRLREKTSRRLEIGVDIVAGSHLDCRNAHAVNLPFNGDIPDLLAKGDGARSGDERGRLQVEWTVRSLRERASRSLARGGAPTLRWRLE